jgi:hypothetical protein
MKQAFENFLELQRCWKFWRSAEKYTELEKEQMHLIHQAFQKLQYQQYATELSTSSDQPVSSTYLLLQETILAMDKDFEMPIHPNQQLNWNLERSLDNRVNLDSHIFHILEFMDERTRDKGTRVSIGEGYYNDPINLTSAFITSRIREVCAHFKNNNLVSAKKTQENFQALYNFINALNGSFQSPQYGSEWFINEVSRIGVELKKKIEFLTAYSKEVDLRVHIESFDQIGCEITSSISSYLVALFLLKKDNKWFHIQHLFESNEKIKAAISDSVLAKPILSLCEVPAFSFIVNNTQDFGQEIKCKPNLFLNNSYTNNVSSEDERKAIARIRNNRHSSDSGWMRGLFSSSKSKSLPEEDKLIEDSEFIAIYTQILGHLQAWSELLITFQKLKGLVSLIGEVAGIVKRREILILTDIMLNNLNKLEGGMNSLEKYLGLKKEKWLKENRKDIEQPKLYKRFADKQETLALIKKQIEICKNSVVDISGKVKICNPVALYNQARNTIQSF